MIPKYEARASFKMECDGCHRWVVIAAKDFTEHQVTGEAVGVVESGITCPNCQKFFRAAFDSKALKAMRKQVQHARGKLQAQLQIRYVKAFDLFQASMKRKLAPRIVESPIH